MSEIREPRMYIRDEVQEKFLKHIAGMIDYWASVELGDSRLGESRHPRGCLRRRFQKFILRIVTLPAPWVCVQFEKQMRRRLEGLAHSILVALDGNAMALPGFVVAPMPHPSDRDYCIENGENFYPEAPDVSCDIAGELHTRMYSYIARIPQR
jgi:hypothetical protein